MTTTDKITMLARKIMQALEKEREYAAENHSGIAEGIKSNLVENFISLQSLHDQHATELFRAKYAAEVATLQSETTIKAMALHIRQLTELCVMYGIPAYMSQAYTHTELAWINEKLAQLGRHRMTDELMAQRATEITNYYTHLVSNYTEEFKRLIPRMQAERKAHPIQSIIMKDLNAKKPILKNG
jgi:hypothetical protein